MYSKHSEVLLQREWSWRAQNVAQNPDSERFYLNGHQPSGTEEVKSIWEKNHEREEASG
tara:strand:- start:626 stop:802 length:177 start_codon:yes stop_codon:yes gene_type:complete